jgi:hypothetical protein
MLPLLPTTAQVSAALSSGLTDVALGLVLLGVAMVLFQIAPRVEEAARRTWFPNRVAEGRRLRLVGQPVVVAGFGGLCLLAGMLRLL